jgi:competence protein ComEC
MAGLALGGRLIGVVLEAWQLLSLAVAVLVVFEPSLTDNVGFQLSVAATAGVLVGARWPVRGLVRRALALTIGAQVAVAPLLLIHFGSVPVLSPVVNLVAAPLVMVATVGGSLGVAGMGFLVEPASWVADLVLMLARGSAGWPQLQAPQFAALLGVGLLVLRYEGLRPMASVAASGMAVVLLVVPAARLEPGQVVVLDVGQGDAILLHGESGADALVDGGPDATRLLDRLRAYGVTELDLMVLTHPHADHATGLIGVIGQIHVEEVWADIAPHSTEASLALLDKLEAYGIEVTAPQVGDQRTLGTLELRVLGPKRRYASPNDQSIVLEAAGTRRMLLAGDIETYAQADMTGVRADVLKVPHQGAGTSDPDWLAAVDAELAVISVGPNEFGHPVSWVIETLERSGAIVRRTDHEGDVVVDLS